MATGSGLVAPGNFPIRDPRKKQQMAGRVVNSGDNYMAKFGMSGPGDWKKAADFTSVEKPTNVRAASPVAQRGN